MSGQNVLKGRLSNLKSLLRMMLGEKLTTLLRTAVFSVNLFSSSATRLIMNSLHLVLTPLTFYGKISKIYTCILKLKQKKYENGENGVIFVQNSWLIIRSNFRFTF